MPAFNATMIDTEAVRARIQAESLEYGQVAADRLAGRLWTHVENGVINPGQVAAVRAAEQVAQAAVFMDERNAGKHNDIRSAAGKGITALILPYAKAAIEIQLERAEVPGLFVPAFEMIHERTSELDNPTVYQLDLPDASFDADHHTDVRLLAASAQIDRIAPRQGLLVVRQAVVIRIIGAEGELWQNPGYTLNGTPRPPEPVDIEFSGIRS